MIWLLILSPIIVILCIYLGKVTVKTELENVDHTKILTSNVKSTGRLNGSFYTETTFMLYYKDGTHKAVTIRNGTSEYDQYMSKLEG